MRLNIVMSIMMMISASLLVAMAVWCIKNRRVRGAAVYSLLAFAMAFHTGGYAFELLSETVEDMYVFIRIEYIGVSFYPFLLFKFTSTYADETKVANAFVLTAVLFLNVLTLVLVNTNSFHFLYYSNVDIDYSHGFPLLNLEMGIWYMLQGILLVLAALYSIVVHIFRIIRLDRRAKGRAVILILGVLAPCVTALLYVLGLLPKHIDFLPLSYLAMTMIHMVGLFRYQLFTVSEITHKMILDSIEEAVIVVAEDSTVVMVNKATKGYFNPLKDLRPGDNVGHYPDLAEVFCNKGTIELHGRHYHIRGFHQERRRCSIYVLNDVTEATEAKQALEALASMDPLTGTFNRRSFLEIGAVEMYRRALLREPVAMVMIDIDHFKRVNDTYGHKAGDEGLLRLCEICRRNIRENDLLARYGGEEFLIFLPGTDSYVAKDIADRIRMAVTRTILEYEGVSFGFTVSLGVSYSKDAQKATMEDLILLADKALYLSKQTGRNRTSVSDVDTEISVVRESRSR